MLYLETESFVPSYNLAFEEFVFQELAQNQDVFLLWQNDPCLVLGKNQNIFEEVNLSYCKEQNLPLVRRMSGGGTVYHDRQNLNFSFILNADQSSDFHIHKVSQPIVEALRSLGLPVELTPRNDLFLYGKKICGTAQHMKKNRLLYHGCLLFDADLQVLEKALQVKTLSIESKGTKSVRSQVTNIKSHLLQKDFSLQDLKQLLKEKIQSSVSSFSVYHLSEEEKEKVLALEKDKYLSWDWLYGRNPSFTLEKTQEKYKLFLRVDQHQVEKAEIFSENFSEKEKRLFEEFFVAFPYEEKALIQKIQVFLKNYPLFQEYFSKEELFSLFWIETLEKR